MPEILTLTDAELDTVLNGTKPVVLLFTGGDGLRTDFANALKTAVTENGDVIFAKIDPAHNPKAVERFNVGSKTLMVGWYCGQEVVRRGRPWGTDLPGALTTLKDAFAADNSATAGASAVVKEEQKIVADGKPVHVTDDTFQQDVVDYPLPVLVDFWAEWCGPCRQVAPVLDKLAKEFAGQIRIAKVDVDANPGLSQTFRVMSIPTIMLFKQRTMVFSQPGALPEPAFRDLIRQLIALEIPPQTQNQAQGQPVQ